MHRPLQTPSALPTPTNEWLGVSKRFTLAIIGKKSTEKLGESMGFHPGREDDRGSGYN